MRKIYGKIAGWWKARTPRQLVGSSVCCDIFAYTVLCANIVATVFDFQRSRWWAGMVSAGISLLLCVVTVIRNYWWQKLLLAQKENIQIGNTLNTLLEVENLRLKKIALAAAAVTNQAERGLPFNLGPLKHSLTEFVQEHPAVDLSKMN